MENKIFLGWAHSNIPTGMNFGDELSPYIVKRITNKNIYYVPVLKNRFHLLLIIAKRFVTFKFKDVFNLIQILFGKKYYLVVGSIIQFYTLSGAVVWGAGCIDSTSNVGKKKYFAVRGPFTRRVLMDKGEIVPMVFGDPALVLRKLYDKEIDKKYKVGVIPHVINVQEIKNASSFETINIIDLRSNSIESIIDQIRSCEFIFTESLHGLIVAHVYSIPAIWSNIGTNKLIGDNIKFKDYLACVEIDYYNPINIIIDDKLIIKSLTLQTDYYNRLLPDDQILEEISENLMNNIPF